MDHALGLARAAGGVQNEQEILRGHSLGRAVSGGGGQVVVSQTSRPSVHPDSLAGVADDEVGGDRRAFGEGLVDDGLEAEPLGAALHAVAGDDAHRTGVLDAVRVRLRAENPANTTLCTAPMPWAQARTATASSGTTGRYSATRSPFFTLRAL